MHTSADKKKEKKSQSVANSISQNQHNGKLPFQFVDNRPESILQRKLQEKIQNNSQRKQVVQTQNTNSTSAVVQRFPWGKSIGIPALSTGLGVLGNFIAPGIGGYVGAAAGTLIGGVAGHWLDTLPSKPKGIAPAKPVNMTDTHVPYPVDVDDHKDRLGADHTTHNNLSTAEQQFLGINTQHNQMTSSLHPQTLNDLGMRLSTLTGVGDASRGQTKMSQQGQAHDAYKYKKLVYDGASASATKTHSNHPHAKEIIGESHHLPNKRQQLIQDLQQGNSKDSLYLELNQEIQPLVNQYRQQYAQNPMTPMPKLLKGYLQRVDGNFRQHNQQYPAQGQAGTYEHLVDEHVKANKNVVFADSPHAKGIPNDKNFKHNREAAMNQSLYEKITEDQAQKSSSYTVLTGAAHVGNNRHGLHKIIGLKDRLGF
jgi:hypothetical protein